MLISVLWLVVCGFGHVGDRFPAVLVPGVVVNRLFRLIASFLLLLSFESATLSRCSCGWCCLDY